MQIRKGLYWLWPASALTKELTPSLSSSHLSVQSSKVLSRPLDVKDRGMLKSETGPRWYKYAAVRQNHGDLRSTKKVHHADWNDAEAVS